MPLDTVTQQKPDQRRLQLFVSPEAHARIRVEAARRDIPPGELVSDLALRHLPAVDPSVSSEDSDVIAQ